MRISLNNDIISSSISDYREKSIDINKVNSLRTLIKFIEYIFELKFIIIDLYKINYLISYLLNTKLLHLMKYQL